MIIAIASGKGGTGKTTVAASLALSLAPNPVLFLDCDVEAPDAALFLKPQIDARERVGVLVPQVDQAKCTFCGQCARICRYNALAVIGQRVLVFAELCHGCGSCTLQCPEAAISEMLQTMGALEFGQRGHIRFGQGLLDIGQAMSPPIIRQLKGRMLSTRRPDQAVILDAPPGTSCPVVETLKGADAALLVTEPTPFGLHDLRLAVQVARDALHLPVGIVINRDGVGNKEVDAYCAQENIPILMRIPFDRRIAQAYSDGVPLTDALPGYAQAFRDLWHKMGQLCLNATQEQRS